MTGPDYTNLERVIPGPEYSVCGDLAMFPYDHGEDFGYQDWACILRKGHLGKHIGRNPDLVIRPADSRVDRVSPMVIAGRSRDGDSRVDRVSPMVIAGRSRDGDSRVDRVSPMVIAGRSRDGFVIGIAVVVIAVLAIVAAASRGVPEPTPQSPSETAAGREGNTQALLGAPQDGVAQTVERHAEAVEVVGSTPTPVTIDRYRGTATWYCLSGSSACTRGYGPGDLVAAIDTDLGFAKGDQLVVRYRDRSVTVTVVDVCLCAGERLIDLTSGAFSRLAPLGHGVIPVTLELAGADPTLPATETKP